MSAATRFDQYDPTDWQTQIDPYPVYAWLREHAPVYQNEKMGFWALSRFDDVWDAHLDYETFSSAWGQTLEKVLTPLPLMISLDPPKHTRVRQLVSKVFTPRRVAELEPTVRAITQRRLEGLEPGDQIDLFERLASSMPMDVISAMLGVPEADRDHVRHQTNAAMHRESNSLDIPQASRDAQAQVAMYFVGFIQERQKRPAGRPDQRPDRRRPARRRDGRADEALLRGAARLLHPARERGARDDGAADLQLGRDPRFGIPTSAPSSRRIRRCCRTPSRSCCASIPPSQVQGRWSTRPWTRHGVTIPAGRARPAPDRRRPPRPAAVHGNRIASTSRRKLDRTVHFGQGPPPLHREIPRPAGMPRGVRGDPRALPRLRGRRVAARVGAQQQRARLQQGARCVSETIGTRRGP
jgi:hypothetical protein